MREEPYFIQGRITNQSRLFSFMLLGLAILLILLWGLGLTLKLLGGIIYIFLVIGIILGIAHFLRTGTRP